jgi:hypothetical protein
VNAAVELHDSEVVAVVQSEGAVVVRLSAYVHRSSGRPGFDPGSGWSQAVDLVFADGVVECSPVELPFTLDDGRVSGGAELAGMLPLPASVPSAVHFEARGLHKERLAVRGSGLEVVPVAEATFVETFPGAKHAEPGAAADRPRE